MLQKKTQNWGTALFAVLLAYITYTFSMRELANNLSDLAGHVYTYIPLLKGAQGMDGWMAVPYFMWHLCVMALEAFTPVPMDAAAAFVCCIFAVFSFYVLVFMMERMAARYELAISPLQVGFFAFALSIVQPVCMYWFDTTSQYLGQFSMNPLHNPTQMCVKPFSLLCLCFTYDILEKFRNPEHRGVFVSLDKGIKKACVALSVTLFLSCMAKPTFAEMFIPAVALLMLPGWLGRVIRKDGSGRAYFRNCLTMLLVSVPALAYILLQYIAYFVMGGSYGGENGSLIITKWMQVWSMYSENVTASILLGMGFPLLIVVINAVYFFKDTLGQLALIGYAVGLLECALLAEGGGKIDHGDFLWPMMSGMTLLWVVAFLRLLVLEQTQNKSRLQRVCLQTAWFVFFLFVLFGVLFLG